MTSHVVEEVKNAIRLQLGFAEDHIVNADDSIVDDLGADSLDLVELVMHLEEAFDIECSDEQAEACKTVQDIIDLANELLHKPKPEPIKAELKKGSRFVFEGDTWEIMDVGPVQTLVKKTDVEGFRLCVNNWQLEIAIEQYNKEQA